MPRVEGGVCVFEVGVGLGECKRWLRVEVEGWDTVCAPSLGKDHHDTCRQVSLS